MHPEDLHFSEELDRCRQELDRLKEENRFLTSIVKESPWFVQVPPEQYEAAMVAVLNKWWQRGNLDRTQLMNLVEQFCLPANFYTITNLDAVRQSMSWSGPYAFQRSDTDGGWLWCQQKSGGEAFVLPADPDYFVTESTQKVLARVAEGCEDLRSKPKFLKALNACHLYPDPDRMGTYRVKFKAMLYVEGHTPPPSARSFESKVRTFESFFANSGAPQATDAFPKGAPIASPIRTEDVLNRIGEVLAEVKRLAAFNDEFRTEMLLLLRSGSSARMPESLLGTNSTLAEPPPPDWWTADALDQAYGKAADAVQKGYSLRIRGLHDTLAGAFPCADVKFQTRHLLPRRDGFNLHPASLRDDNSFICETCGVVAEQQFFLTAESKQQRFVWVFLPPGLIRTSDFPRGYSMLADIGARSSSIVRSIIRPALLIPSSDNSDEFLVRQLLQLQEVPPE